MTNIRVDPSQLREASSDLLHISSGTFEHGKQVQSAALGAPSYDGQFGPRVQALGVEALARAQSIANNLYNLSDDLQSRANAFESADQAGAAGFLGLAINLPFKIEWPPWLRPPKIPPWIWEFLIGLVPFGDAYDIIKQAINSLKGEDVDELVLALAALGLVADAGWLQPIPSVEDAPNAGLALLKALAKQIPAGPARDALGEIVEQAAKNPDDLLRLSEVLVAFTKHDELIESMIKNQDALIVVLKSGPEAVELLAKYGDDGITFVNRFGDNGLELLMRNGGDLSLSNVERILNLEDQAHHLLTNKYPTQWTPVFTDLIEDYGLDINGAWNVIDIPHAGSHAKEYHEWVYNTLREIDKVAQGDSEVFLELFDDLIKQPVKDNPFIVRREWYP